jgi:hypothetical protein
MDETHFPQTLVSNPTTKRLAVNICLYPDGIDCIWLGVDKNDHIGAFITAGIAPIPIKFLEENTEDISDIEEIVYRLPIISAVEILISVKRPDSFIELSSRGLFVYDWTDINRKKKDEINLYEPVSRPENPIKELDLRKIIYNKLILVRFSDLDFTKSEPIDILKKKECIIP